MHKYLSISLLLIISMCAYHAFAGDDAIGSFKTGVARLEERKARIFVGGNPQLRFDIKKTDSLLAPIIGLVTVEAGDPTIDAIIYELRFTYDNGKWKLDRYLWRLGRNSPPREMPLGGMVGSQAQACFDGK
jgi:hypothetical protein